MRMGDLEKETGVNRETIRVYVRKGLIPPPVKVHATAARYDSEHVRAILAVRNLQHEHHMTLDQIAAMLRGDISQRRVEAPAFRHLENLVAARLGFAPFDPAPFACLQGAASIGALLVATLILTTQRREDRLADHRAQLILELSIANDQKIAKIIGLLEESRRDNPAITDRVDDQAAAMSNPSDTEAVLAAIKELRDDIP